MAKEAERIVTGAASREDEAVDRAIRPRTLAEYVGQTAVKTQLEIFVSAARQRRRAVLTSGTDRAPLRSLQRERVE